MHITIDPHPDSFGGLYAIITIFGILGVFALIVAVIFFVSGSSVRGTKSEKITAAIAAGVFVVSGALVAVNIASLSTQSNALNAAFAKQLSQQISERYQLDLTASQVRDLDYNYLAGYAGSPIGTTQVLMDNTITEISLYHIGDKWLLTDAGNSKQITELPTYGE